MDKINIILDFIKEYPLAIFFVLLLIVLIAFSFKTKNLDGIKNRRAGQGQHGDARFINLKEENEIFTKIKYEPKKWREGDIPKDLPIGIIWGTKRKGLFKRELIALVDTKDKNGMMIGPAGVGKTAYFFMPNMEYASALGLSMCSLDTKGDLYRNMGQIQKQYYGYNIVVLDLRNPLQSDKFNLIQLINEYMDKSKEAEDKEERLLYLSRAEKYAKITAKNIIETADFKGGGQNAYFYDSAEGLITSCILLLAEFGEKKERHIVSVFKMIQEMCVFISDEKAEQSVVSRFGQIIKMLPENHKAKWFAGAAIEADMKTALSVFSTSLSRLTKFIDSQLEQMICFDGKFTAESFVENPTSVFLVLPEEDPGKHFMFSLFLNQIYRELMIIADEKGGKLDKRVFIFEDEFGTIPQIKDVDMMFSASRSRGILSYPIIQAFEQLDDKYGEKKAKVIRDNCQNLIFSGFAPTSKAPEELSKAMGTYTVQSGSVTEGKGTKRSVSYNLIGVPLMTPDKIRTMKNGEYVVMMTGSSPMKTKLPLFLKWGIKLPTRQYKVRSKIKKIHYISVDKLENKILANRFEEIQKIKKENTIDKNTLEEEITLPEESEVKEFTNKKE